MELAAVAAFAAMFVAFVVLPKRLMNRKDED
jgi:hypothetical protein